MTTHKEPVRRDLQVPKTRMNRGVNPRKGVGTFMTASPEVREWLKNSIKNHWYFYTDKNTTGLWIAFHDKKDALLWKLTWH